MGTNFSGIFGRSKLDFVSSMLTSSRGFFGMSSLTEFDPDSNVVSPGFLGKSNLVSCNITGRCFGFIGRSRFIAFCLDIEELFDGILGKFISWLTSCVVGKIFGLRGRLSFKF